MELPPLSISPDYTPDLNCKVVVLGYANVEVMNNIPDIVGKRVELIDTDDPYTKLKPGDKGTVTDISGIPFGDTPYQIWVNWDNHVTFALLPGHDRYEIVEGESTA